MNEKFIWSLAFGSGQRGWDALSLYVVDPAKGRLFELDVGRAGQPPPK